MVSRNFVELIEHRLIGLNAYPESEFQIRVCLVLPERILRVSRVDTGLRETSTSRNDSPLVVKVERVVLVEELTDSLVYLESRIHILAMNLQVELELKRDTVEIGRERLRLSVDNPGELSHGETVGYIARLYADRVQLKTSLWYDVEISVYFLDTDVCTLIRREERIVVLYEPFRRRERGSEIEEEWHCHVLDLIFRPNLLIDELAVQDTEHTHDDQTIEDVRRISLLE
jgi:hypothetical protein